MNRKLMKLYAATALAVVAAALFSSTVFAAIATNTIDALATVSPSGNGIRVTGPIQVTADERVEVRATVTQRSTGAVAEGSTMFRGTGASQQWEAVVHVRGDAKFIPGPATAVGMASTFVRGKAADAHQWLVNITLVAN
jgi:hypothetical protein